MLKKTVDEYKDRLAKLEKIRQEGINPYPDSFDKKQSVAEILKLELGAKVKTAGRILTVREMGKIAFCHLQDSTAKIQLVLKEDKIGKEQFGTFLKLLAPFAPHLAEEFWNKQGSKGFVHEESWPVYNPEFLQDDEQAIVVQINGKTRGEVQVLADADKKTIEDAARAAVTERLKGKKILRTVVIPNRLVNFVTE